MKPIANVLQVPYIKVDFSRWKDEDESDEDEDQFQDGLENVISIFAYYILICCLLHVLLDDA